MLDDNETYYVLNAGGIQVKSAASEINKAKWRRPSKILTMVPAHSSLFCNRQSTCTDTYLRPREVTNGSGMSPD